MPLQMLYTVSQAIAYPGMKRSMDEWDAQTYTAVQSVYGSCAVQRAGKQICSPLTGGEFVGIALPPRVTTTSYDAWDDYDNCPVLTEGVIAAIADAAIPEGAGLNWNGSTWRWTPAAVSGSIYRTVGVEAETAAAGAGSLFWLRIRRVPN